MRNAILLLLRIYAYLFELALCFLLLGAGLMTVAGGENNLKLGMLPWEGATLTRAVLIMGVVGIVCAVLALAGWLRWLFPLWTLFVFALMFRGYFLTSYSFSSADEFKLAVWLTAGALLAFLASLSLFRRHKT